MLIWGDGIRPPPVINTKLFVFRCKALGSLVNFDGIDDCTVGRRRREIHVKMECNVVNSLCLFLLVRLHFDGDKPGGPRISDTWGQFPSQRLMSAGINVERNAGGLRHFVVGNRQDGYSGVERNANALFVAKDCGRHSNTRGLDIVIRAGSLVKSNHVIVNTNSSLNHEIDGDRH